MERNRKRFKRLNIRTPSMSDYLSGETDRTVECPRLSRARSAIHCIRCKVFVGIVPEVGSAVLYLTDNGLDEKALTTVIQHGFAQRTKWGNQTHSVDRWNTILSEESGEIARAILEDNLEKIEEEGVHIATIALKMSHMARKKRKEIESSKEEPR
ncbi:hypothetical protein LCGC14_2314950 [marine sediment metagenome]|uniref:Uncharacterized protein n=1 Tax=marine sediment metagenome TaxID=412755 RepID=A0A0F9CJK2_9ZZZZ